jgi:hypothetical protein
MRRPRKEALDVDPERIILLCSIGTHFHDAAHELKRRFPRAKLTAVAPAQVVEPLSGTGFLDDVIEMSKNKLHPLTDFGECVRLLKAIRAERSDLVVTMYESAALNLFQSLSGGRNHAVFDTRRTLYPIKVGRFYLLRLIFGNAGRVVLGRLAYALIKVTLSAHGRFGKRG